MLFGAASSTEKLIALLVNLLLIRKTGSLDGEGALVIFIDWNLK